MTEVGVSFDWVECGEITATGDTITWPEMPNRGGVYRLVFTLGDRTRTYVGETTRFARRFAAYQNPGGSTGTNTRMRDRTRDLLNVPGGTARVDVQDNVRVVVDGQEADQRVIPDPFLRHLLENAALVSVAAEGAEIVNGTGYPPGELWPVEA